MSATTPSALPTAGTNALVDAREIDVRDPAREAAVQRPRGFEREPRLADAAGADECQQANVVASEQRADLGQLALAADRRVRRRRERRGQRVGHRLGVELGVVREDHRFQPAQLRPRLEAELVDQEPPSLAHRLERVGLPARAVEREHQPPAQALPQRVLGHQGAQLADQIAGLAVFEIGGQSFLGRFQAQLLEPLDLGLREVVEPVVGERRSAPQRERLDELAAAHQRLEAVGVERRALDLQRVARGPPAHGQRLAEPRAQA